MRSVLVCTDGSPYAATALSSARSWAERLAMRVKVLFVEDVRLTRGPFITGYYGPVGMAPGVAYPDFYDDVVKAVKQHARRAIDDARKLFDGFSGQVEYVVREGLVHESILQEAKTVDLLCLGRRGDHAQWGGEDVGSTLLKVLRQSQRPVLTTSADFRPLTRLLVAYDGSPSANRAARTACDLASTARLPMVVVTVATSSAARPAAEVALNEACQLASAYEDVQAAFALLDSPEVDAALIAHAAAQSCDLIVMGACGHSRIRQWLLTSTTTAILLRSTLPVLLVR